MVSDDTEVACRCLGANTVERNFKTNDPLNTRRLDQNVPPNLGAVMSNLGAVSGSLEPEL